MSWKKSLLLTCHILGLLVNTFAANEKYPVPYWENLAIPIQMQLSQKRKTFSQFFAEFVKYAINFRYLEKKDDPHRFWNLEITDSENVVSEMSKKSRLREPFHKQHGKRAQAMLRSESQDFGQIH